MYHLQTLSSHSGRVWNVSWNPAGSILASCGEDKNIILWGLERPPITFGLKTILTDGHARTIRSTAWSPCGRYLASASFDATVAIWDKKSGEFECIATLEGHENEVKCVAWSKSGRLLATCSRDKSVWVWDVLQEEEYECAAVLNSHSQDVKKVVWHPEANVFASASYDNTVRIFKVDINEDDWTSIAVLKSHQSTVWSVAFNSTGTRLASCSDDCTVKIWQEYLPNNPEGIATVDGEATWKCVCTISGYHGRTIYDVAWCHLTDLIATACADNSIQIFREEGRNLDSNQPSFMLVARLDNAHEQDVNCVTWNPSVPGLLASAGDDEMVKLWQLNMGRINP